MDVARLGIPIDSLPDEVLLAGLGTGDPDIAVAFVRRFQRTVFGVAVAVLGDQRLAEDVAQQTFERAWRHAQVYDSRRGSVRTWLTTIAHNLAIDAVRAHKPVPMDPAELGGMLEAIRDTPERRAVANEDSAELRAELLMLPREQARAVVLAGIYGLTAKQIAELESIPLGTAKTRIRTAMEKLRGKLSVKRVDHE
jgi:RNA polymerase sigma-70 factor (ECF subfamily)